MDYEICKHGIYVVTCAYCLGIKFTPTNPSAGRYIVSEGVMFGCGGVVSGIKIPAVNYKSKAASITQRRKDAEKLDEQK